MWKTVFPIVQCLVFMAADLLNICVPILRFWNILKMVTLLKIITEKYELQIKKLQPRISKICQYGHRAAAHTRLFSLHCFLLNYSYHFVQLYTYSTEVGRFFEQYVQQLRLNYSKTINEDVGWNMTQNHKLNAKKNNCKLYLWQSTGSTPSRLFIICIKVESKTEIFCLCTQRKTLEDIRSRTSGKLVLTDRNWRQAKHCFGSQGLKFHACQYT